MGVWGARAAEFCVVVGTLGLPSCSGGDEGPLPRAELLKPSTCNECHQNHFLEWSGSMHAYASKDPVFRAMNARGQREAGIGDFCVKCHAPMAVAEGATKDGLNLDELPEELQGVTCYFCHQVTAAHGENDNPLVLANDQTMRGGISNPLRNKAHRGAYSPLDDSSQLESSTLCGSCHDISVPAHFSGASADVELERTFSEWKTSVFATAPVPLTCGGCHFGANGGGKAPISSYPGSPKDRVRHLHDFPGVDVALTEFPQMEAQRKAVAEMLTRAVAMTVCVNNVGTARIVLENRGAGHGVPSGAAQDRRMWLEVRAFNPSGADPLGELVFSSGAVPVGTPVVGFKDPDGSSPRVFRDETFDAAENPEHFFWKIASTKPGALNAPVTNDPTDLARYHNVGDQVSIGPIPLRDPTGQKPFFVNSGTVRVTLHMQPIGLDVLDAVYDSTVDATTAAEGAAVRAAMPIIDSLPNAGIDATVEWKQATAKEPGMVATEQCSSSATAP